MDKHRSLRRVLLPFVLLAGCAATTAPVFARHYMTAEFMTKNPRPMRLAVLPVQAEFLKSQAVMTAEMVKEAAALEEAAASAIQTQLHAKGYEVRLITNADYDVTPGLRELVTGLNGRYDEEWSKIMRDPKDVRAGRYNAGECVSEICTLLGVDGLLIGRVGASAPTGGRQALTLILSLGSAYAQGMSILGLGVLDGRTGRVEAYFHAARNCTLGSLVKKPDKIMSALVEKVADDYPAASEILTPKKGSEVAEAKDTATADDTAIQDFESVLKQKGVEAGPAGEPPPPVETPAEAPPEAAPTPTPAPAPGR